jgi:hypothetical protein
MAEEKKMLTDLFTGEINVVPISVCQLNHYDFAHCLERMEGTNPSLSRLKTSDPSEKFDKVGIDFNKNLSVYRKRETKRTYQLGSDEPKMDYTAQTPA